MSRKRDRKGGTEGLWKASDNRRRRKLKCDGLTQCGEDNSPCSICKRSDESLYPILLCDTPGCKGQHHTMCAGLDHVPPGDWFCNDCLKRAKDEDVLLMSLFPPLEPDATNEKLDIPDEMQEDSLATRIWSLYSEIKKQTPSQECSENLTGRIIKWAIRLSNQNKELNKENNRLKKINEDLEEMNDDLTRENNILDEWNNGREQRVADAWNVEGENADLKRQITGLERLNADPNEWNNGREQRIADVERENADPKQQQLSGEHSLFLRSMQHSYPPPISSGDGEPITADLATLSHASIIYPSSPLGPSSNCSNFWPSKYELKSSLETAEVSQTATFKNSHYNTAHFINPKFQPEVWTPESEEPTRKRGIKRMRCGR